MRYEGYYINSRDERIEVVIRTEGADGDTVQIGQDGLFFGEDPVELTSEADDTLTVVMAQRATVRLLAAGYTDDFYGLTCRHARVNIRREGVLVFAGYIVPQVLSCGWDAEEVEVELNCVDALGALEYERYGGVGAAGTDFAALRRGASLRSMGELLEGAVRAVAEGLDLEDEGREPVVLYDGSRLTDSMDEGSPFVDYRLSESLLLGADEEDTWTLLEVVEETLRYLNLHIVQEGMTFRVYADSTPSSAASVTWCRLDGSDPAEPLTIGLHTLSASETTDEPTKLETTEAYSRVELTAKTAETDVIVESPLEEDSLTPVYSSLNRYVTEYYADLTSTDKANAKAALVLVGRNDRLTADVLEHLTVTDWYVQLMRHPNWTFYCGMGSTRWNVTGGMDWTKDRNARLSLAALFPGSALLLRTGRGRKGGDRKDTSEDSKMSTSTSLVIGVNGNGGDPDDGMVPSVEALREAVPCAVYEGGGSGGGALAPISGDTINYVVISGRLKLNARCLVSEEWDVFTENVKDDVSDKLETVEGARGKGLRLMRYWDQDRWSDTPRTATGRSQGYVPPMDSLPQSLEFKYSAVGDSADHVRRVAVLACMLRVGDKCVVEKPLGETLGTYPAGTGDGELTDYVWQKFKTREECADEDEYYAQSFLIGFDPKVGDQLIGTEYAIRSNFDVQAGIDAEGTAIPIGAGSGVNGSVHFEILGPVNVVWNEVTRRHPTFFRHTKWTEKSVAVLSRVSNITLTDFEVRVVSDNGHRTVGSSSGNLVYSSREDSRYSQVKDDLEMRITSALTSIEAERMETGVQVCLSTPVDRFGQPVVMLYDVHTGEEEKPEVLYLDRVWREWHAPRIEVYQTVEETADQPRSLWERWKLPSLAGRTFRVVSIDRNLTEGTARLRLKETGDE